MFYTHFTHNTRYKSKIKLKTYINSKFHTKEYDIKLDLLRGTF
jgi:hypothetical protein